MIPADSVKVEVTSHQDTEEYGAGMRKEGKRMSRSWLGELRRSSSHQETGMCVSVFTQDSLFLACRRGAH